jgi:hypothetical protein
VSAKPISPGTTPSLHALCWFGRQLVRRIFDDSPITRIRSLPVIHDAIVHALKWRNIMVHPRLLIRTDILRAVGGYCSNYTLLQDWDLYVRLVITKARFAVIPKVLISMLVHGQAERRGGMQYLQHEICFRTFCWDFGLIGCDNMLL